MEDAHVFPGVALLSLHDWLVCIKAEIRRNVCFSHELVQVDALGSLFGVTADLHLGVADSAHYLI